MTEVTLTEAGKFAYVDDFELRVALGKKVEDRNACYILAQGGKVLPLPPKNALLGPDGSLIIPDLMIFMNGKIFWLEVKAKLHFTWRRNQDRGKPSRWQCGVNIDYWNHYVRVEEATGIPVWMTFLCESTKTWPKDVEQGAPRECPTGFFCQSVDLLKDNVDHKWPHGPYGGMIYWDQGALIERATLEEFNRVVADYRRKRAGNAANYGRERGTAADAAGAQ